MKKIVCFNVVNLYVAGGMERMCISLANSLVEEGYEIHIVSFEAGKEISPFFPISEKVKLYKLLPNKIERCIDYRFKWLRYAQWKYKRFLKQYHINLIIDVGTAHTPFTSAIANELEIKHIAWDHFCYQYLMKKSTCDHILSCIKNDVDKLVLLTDKDCENYITLADIPREKVVRIYNFSSIEEDCYTSHESKQVLAMGRLQPEKGFEMLLHAWSFVEKENKEWNLEIVGDGPERQNLLDLITKLNLKNVTISPATKNPKAKYKEASIFVLASRFEGLGLVLIEAANMSLPIVAFACDNGPKELLDDGSNGLLITPGDTKGMAERLLHLMSSSELRKSMGQNALKSMEKTRKEIVVKQWIELIDNL